jgi:hypothetical protein
VIRKKEERERKYRCSHSLSYMTGTTAR